MRELPQPPPPQPPPPPLPPPASHPPIQPDQFQHIPHHDRTFGYHQTNIQPHHHHHHHLTASPLNTGDNFGCHESYPPPPPPHNLPPPPPMFTRPPPAVPPRFPGPPPAMPNIPFQPAFRNPMITTPLECSTTWHQHNLPPGPQCHQMQANRAPLVTAEGVLCKDSVGQKEEQDAKWLKEFEKNIKSCPLPPSPPPPPTESTTTTTKNSVKLAEVQRLVLESYSLKEQLCGLEEELTQVSSSAKEEEWDQLVQKAEGIKGSLNQILETFQDLGFIEHTKTLLRQRRAKRNRIKRRKKELQLDKEELKRKREEEEAKIDAWRAKLQREEDTKRREDAVKREADSVLGEVRQKQSEGQRMLQLLDALAELRHTRATQAAAQGTPKDAEADQRFNTTTEMLGKVVRQQLKEYKLEEQTLRVMMEESASAALSAKRDANFARYEDSIRKLLFGPTAAADTQGDAGQSLGSLVQRRQEWDQYVVEGDSLLSSAIPLSWVLPPTHPHPSWAAFLKT